TVRLQTSCALRPWLYVSSRAHQSRIERLRAVRRRDITSLSVKNTMEGVGWRFTVHLDECQVSVVTVPSSVTTAFVEQKCKNTLPFRELPEMKKCFVFGLRSRRNVGLCTFPYMKSQHVMLDYRGVHTFATSGAAARHTRAATPISNGRQRSPGT